MKEPEQPMKTWEKVGLALFILSVVAYLLIEVLIDCPGPKGCPP